VTLATSSVFGGTALWVLPTNGGTVPNDWVNFGNGVWLGVGTPCNQFGNKACPPRDVT